MSDNDFQRGQEEVAVGFHAFSAAAAVFTPGAAPSAEAPEVPSSGFSAYAAAANEFVPGLAAWGADAGAYTDGSAAFAASAMPFQPGEWSIDGGYDAKEYIPDATGTYGFGAYPGDGAFAGGGGCMPESGTMRTWFNADAFMSDSDSDEEERSPITLDIAAATSPALRVTQPAGEEAAIAEMSERTMREWLQRFANDGDEHALYEQWLHWTSQLPEDGDDVSGESRDRRIGVVAWLLAAGLDDCRSATPVVNCLRHLCSCEPCLGHIVQESLCTYSPDILDDIALDNPLCREFVQDVSALLTTFESNGIVVPDAAPAIGASAAPVDTPGGAAAEEGTGVPSPVPTGENIYSSKRLLAIRNALLDVPSWVDDLPEVRWGTEAVPKSLASSASAGRRSQAKGGSTSDSRKSSDSNAQSLSWRAAAPSNSSSAKNKKTPKEALTASPNSWAAQLKLAKESSKQKSASSEPKETVEDAQFLREVRSILNKLTVEKFEQLSAHLVSLVAQSTRPHRGIPVLMQLVFEKATTQHHFINMYVSLCAKIHHWLMETQQNVAPESQSNFKRILLNQCQLSFEQYLEPPGGLEGLTGSELYEAQVKYKTRMLGNIKLVGELIRHGMLVSKIALAVAEELVRDDPMCREERLETLAVFLETVGPALDDPVWTHHAAFVRVFQKVGQLTKDASLPSRIRFLLRDLLDLRNGNWRERKTRALDADAPTTIAEVHQKAAQQTGGSRNSSAAAARDMSNKSWRDKMAGKASSAHQGGQAKDTSTPQGGRRKGSATSEERQISAAGNSPAASGKPATPQSRIASPKISPSTPTGSMKFPSPKPSPKGAPKQNPKGAGKASIANNTGGTHPASPKANANQQRPQAAAPKRQTSASGSVNGCGAAPPPQAVPDVAPTASAPEMLRSFHKELANMVRQLGSGRVDLASAVSRLLECPLPPGCSELDEAADIIARVVDEPRAARQRLMPLLPALAKVGILATPGLFAKAVEVFSNNAFADPSDIDPPDLPDIVVDELIPALGLSRGDVRLPAAAGR
eukprot:TRINITY_DN54487_c0_g1_i1.p1 TRINITY_DN54487_c0_g1~~TRINITY_DN54487_c0_g1_i1.p1  ORF type:complete len:1036 (-),score=220.43 TRINITY_DN54487_c0_g1_i1:122-3229(-)